ncbi:hypothetical protein DUI87_35642 [Hirundo rustica rustica]|uniref:ribonuclease H n=1 Tax=Hirundo rustica rustica TaxID=333673 RepID=A0A3M0INP9_HIRRU|nr:hypothetical protein DUI87_35642 [Hirundo rustica rustica]
MKLTAEDLEEINPEVWAEGGKSGLLNIPPIEVKMQPGTPPIRIKQYPMSLEGKKGLIPIIEQLLKEGILEPCMSPHNTPILAVKKAEGKYRLVQDLREINKRTITKHPVVPNPYNLLSQIPQEHAWFTIIDLKDAFWACPLAEGSRDWFAFEWDHPETKRRQQLRWTRLPQGFTESPNLFGQALERLLEQFTPEGQVQILQYVDDLLISGENQLEVRTTSIKLLNFLGEKGLKVSKKKLQFVKPEVTYLGHLIGKGYKKLSPERIAGIIAIPAPKTKRDIRKLLGLFGYCRHWIDEYTQNVRFLYDKLKEFDLFVNTEGGVAYGVLAQEWGGCKKPIAFLSKILDPVARGWPACLQAVAATAVLVEESQKLTLNGKIQIHTPHDIKTVLSQKAPGWVTDSRILKYEITLINSENLRLTVSKNLNPAQFLSGEPPLDLEHDCLELMSLQTKVREDLESTPLPYGKRLFTDGSSRVLEGKRVSGYAVVEGSTIEDIQVRETGKLPSSWSAQLCEIYAVKRGLDLLGGDRKTIYTDSKYAFGIVHTFGKIWEERGYLNSKGKDLVHKEMIRSVLTSLLKPIEIAVVHVKGHQKETTFEGKGNQLADKEAKRAAQDPKGSIRILALNETSEEEGGEEKPNVLPCIHRFRLTNRGHHFHRLFWKVECNSPAEEEGQSTSALSSPEAKDDSQSPKRTRPVFGLEPPSMDLQPGESVDMVLQGFSRVPQVVRDYVRCEAVIGTGSVTKNIIETIITCEFIDPSIEVSPRQFSFRVVKKPSDVLTLHYQPLIIKNTCSLPLDLMLSLERPFQVCNANRQPLPDGQPVTVDVKQTCRLYIAFDPAYKLDFNSWKEKKVLKIEMVRGHPSVEQITLWGEVHFPNLQIQPSTLEFGCVMAGTEEVHSLEMTNCSPLPVKYHWAFQTDSQANRVIYELHPPKFKPKPPKVKSIYVEHLPTQWRRFQIRNVEEPATTLEESRDLAQSPGAEAFRILPLSGVLQPGERQQVSFTFFGHLNTIAGLRALCRVEGGPTYKVELTGGASRVSYFLNPREIDCGLQIFNEFHHSTVTLENTCKVKFNWVINPSTADQHLPGVFLVNPNFVNFKSFGCGVTVHSVSSGNASTQWGLSEDIWRFRISLR